MYASLLFCVPELFECVHRDFMVTSYLQLDDSWLTRIRPLYDKSWPLCVETVQQRSLCCSASFLTKQDSRAMQEHHL